MQLNALHSARDGVTSLILAASYVFVATTLVYRRSVALYAFIISRDECRIEESWPHGIQQGVARWSALETLGDQFGVSNTENVGDATCGDGQSSKCGPFAELTENVLCFR